MNNVNNLIRIKEIAKCIAPYKIIADVGCDHGFLTIMAFEDYGVTKCYAIDNKEGPLNSAINNMKNKPYYDQVEFLLSDGITDIGSDTECVVIAGMGGTLIADILSKDLKNVKRLVLEPNRNSEDVRRKVASLGYAITKEKIVFEKGKYYEIIVCDKVDGIVTYSDLEYEFGPCLLKEKSLYFKEKWFMVLENLKDIDDENVKKRLERIKEIL